jgi:hypothetical protein
MHAPYPLLHHAIYLKLNVINFQSRVFRCMEQFPDTQIRCMWQIFLEAELSCEIRVNTVLQITVLIFV